MDENESAKAPDEEKAEAELLAEEDSESTISLDSGNMIKNMTYFEYITHYKTLHHIFRDKTTLNIKTILET